MAIKIYSTRQAAAKYAKTVGGKVTQANGKFVVMTTTNSNATRRQQNATSTPKKPTTLQKARAATQGVRTRARVLTGAGRLDGPNTSKAALARESARVAVEKVKNTTPASAGAAISSAASSAKKSVKRTAKRGVGAVRTGIATLKTKRLKAKRNKAARNLTKGSMGGKGKSYSQLTSKQKVAMGGGRRGPSETKRTTSQSIGVAKRSVSKAFGKVKAAMKWGSPAQKAALKKAQEASAKARKGVTVAGKGVARKVERYNKFGTTGRSGPGAAGPISASASRRTTAASRRNQRMKTRFRGR